MSLSSSGDPLNKSETAGTIPGVKPDHSISTSARCFFSNGSKRAPGIVNA